MITPQKYLDILGKCFSDFCNNYIFKLSSMLEVGDEGLDVSFYKDNL